MSLVRSLYNNQLCGLDRGNKGTFDASGIHALASAISVNAVLTECNVLKNALDVESAKTLAKIGTDKRIMLSGIKHDQTEANFSGRGLSPADGILIASDLSVSAVLTNLDLFHNDIGVEGGEAIADALKVNVVLKKCDMRYNNMGDGGKQMLRDAVKGRKDFTLLV